MNVTCNEGNYPILDISYSCGKSGSHHFSGIYSDFQNNFSTNCSALNCSFDSTLTISCEDTGSGININLKYNVNYNGNTLNTSYNLATLSNISLADLDAFIVHSPVQTSLITKNDSSNYMMELLGNGTSNSKKYLYSSDNKIRITINGGKLKLEYKPKSKDSINTTGINYGYNYATGGSDQSLNTS